MSMMTIERPNSLVRNGEACLWPARRGIGLPDLIIAGVGATSTGATAGLTLTAELALVLILPNPAARVAQHLKPLPTPAGQERALLGAV